MRLSAHRVAAALASAILLAGFIATIVGYDPNASVLAENRARARFPSLRQGSDWPGYVDQLNAFLQDNYGFRAQLIRGRAIFRERVLNANSADNVFLNAIGID